MIISHERKFIFIKTKKTAGSSFEIALSKYCGPRDVITPLGPIDEPLRVSNAGKGPSNFHRPLGEHAATSIVRLSLTGKREMKFREHMPAVEVRELVGRKIWDSYYKFTIVRNPYEAIVSRYYHFMKSNNHHVKRWKVNNFDQFIRYLAHMINENWTIYTESDRLLVDEVLRFEHLEQDALRLTERLGIPRALVDDLRAIKSKGNYRPKDGTADKLIGAAEAAVIRHLCVKEIEMFGYDFQPIRLAV